MATILYVVFNHFFDINWPECMGYCILYQIKEKVSFSNEINLKSN